jgi:molybdopterin molybdotransferase
MIDEAQALARILESIEPPGGESRALADACGFFSVADLFATVPLPGFDNSAMDGYAVRAVDAKKGARLKVAGEQPAGADLDLSLRAGGAIRVFTGAPMPRGADAVVMQEDVFFENGEIVVNEGVEPGEFVRRRGCDLCEGQKILARGGRIEAATLALLASQGLREVRVGRAPRVAILSTGDELVPPDEPLAAGKIYESNAVMLAALVEKTGARAERLGIAPDERDGLRSRLQGGLRADALIVSGGVSVGERDFVKAELQALGARLDVWRVAIKPGKPFVFGRTETCKIFGLPGNPVSSFVTFLQFVRPALLKMMGARDLELPSVQVTTAADLKNDGDRAHYIRGKIDGGVFAPALSQQSHALFALAQCDAMVRVAPGEFFPAGAAVTARMWPCAV